MENTTAKRGRPPKGAGRTKCECLDIRVETTEKQAFRDAAMLAGLDMSAWIRERLRANARKELEEAKLPVAFMSKDQIVEARFHRPSNIMLKFADGFEGTWPIGALEIDFSNMKLSTIQATADQTTIRIKSKWGDDVAIDSSVIRAAVDPQYAAEIETAFLAIRGPIENLRVTAKKPSS